MSSGVFWIFERFSGFSVFDGVFSFFSSAVSRIFVVPGH